MLAFRFDVARGELHDLDGRSLGHVTVESNTGTATSEGKTPGQALMVFLSLPLLLDGLRRLFRARRARIFRFTGIGSSFAIVFTMEGDDRLRIASGGVDLGSHSKQEVVEAVWRGTRAFFGTGVHALDITDIAYDDLEAASAEFQEAFRLTAD